MCGNVTFPCRFFRLRTKHDFEQAGSLRFVLLPECLQQLNGLHQGPVLIHPVRPQAAALFREETSLVLRLSSKPSKVARKPHHRSRSPDPSPVEPGRSEQCPSASLSGDVPKTQLSWLFRVDPNHGAMRLHRMIRAENGSALGCLLQAPDQSE